MPSEVMATRRALGTPGKAGPVLPDGQSATKSVSGTVTPPKIYYLHCLLAGPLSDWPRHLARSRSMGFDYVAIPPPFAPGSAGNVFLTADFDLPHPLLDLGQGRDAIGAIAEACAEHGLKLVLDIVVDRIAADSVMIERDWYRCADNAALPDPRAPASSDAAIARLESPEIMEALVRQWAERLGRWQRQGAVAFRCLGLDRVPPEFWRQLRPYLGEGTGFLAWTPGLAPERLADLAGVGFDYVFAKLDGIHRLDDYEALRRVAPVVLMPELPFGPRLAPRGGAPGAAYRRAIALANAMGDGVLVPMGFEFGASRPLDPIYSVPEDFAEAESNAAFALETDIAAANGTIDRVAALGHAGPWRRLSRHAILRTDNVDPRRADQALVVIVNSDLSQERPLPLSLAPLPPAAGAAFADATRLDGDGGPDAPLKPGEIRLVRVVRSQRVTPAPMSRRAAERAAKAPRIAIEAVTPSIDAGRFAVKRLVGEPIEVEADIFIEGHDSIAASLLWRPVDQREWMTAPLTLIENDRWRGTFLPQRVGRHFYAVEAWLDRWAGLCRAIAARHEAGQDVSLDIRDAIEAVKAAKLPDLVERLLHADEASQIALLLAEETRALMAAADERPFLARSVELAVEVDRPQAGFASWYEMFPRSATEDPGRHGTFADVIGRLPAIAAMGFDVLYFPPIHPIGTTNRKGRNNALTAGPDDPGSPYAIGAPAGGHSAIHPALGTLDDFHRLRDAAFEHGIEIALDFAVQCSPDHPWLKEHRDWFRHRADGSIRYAENPPKKYEDIVNPDFYAAAAVPDLWLALRDAVRFWIDQGIRTFRVDNPHTKPLPFWEWLIADIRARRPDILFLGEAFTRPKLMYRLAKLGFTQSYSYFTWRNTKWELTEYLRELTEGPPRDFFRPNFFVNTPDINPYFLQNSGRAGFLIRAALATTLSGLWGMYSGFELCEAVPLPGREEYNDSEKYQLRPRDFGAPGNIVAEIAQLNRIRRDQVALQSHLGVTFYNAFNDHILIYGKAQRRRGKPLDDMILVAVNLDPHQIQEATYELPLWEFGLPDQGSLLVEDLVRPQNFRLTGKLQRMRLDPHDLPYAIWRLHTRDE